MHRDALDLPAAGEKLTPHFPPVVINRAARRTKSRLRVVLLNAAGGKRFRDIVTCLRRPQLKGADVILLCEVNAGIKPSAGRDVAAEMAAMLEMSCAYIPEFGVTNSSGEVIGYMGNAILSAAPFDDVLAVAMHRPSTPPMLRRRRRWARKGLPTGLVTRVNFGGKELT